LHVRELVAPVQSAEVLVLIGLEGSKSKDLVTIVISCISQISPYVGYITYLDKASNIFDLSESIFEEGQTVAFFVL